MVRKRLHRAHSPNKGRSPLKARTARENGKLGGRPAKQIDFDQFDRMCGMQMSLRDIATVFGVSVDTIERAVKREKKMGFAEYFASKGAIGRMSLRSRQWEVALGRQAVYDDRGNRVQSERDPNITMLIWLGKNELNQAEKMQTHEGKDSPPSPPKDLDSELTELIVMSGYQLVPVSMKVDCRG